jgi:hypothetical protein
MSYFLPEAVKNRAYRLKVPKREIFDRSDFPDFYTHHNMWATSGLK